MTAVMPKDVVVLWADYQGSDWLAIYIDGDRAYEGHPPDPERLLEVLGLDSDQRTFPSDNMAVPGRRGLPLRLPRSAE